MAIFKEIINENGVSNSYHRLEDIGINIKNSFVLCLVSSYISQNSVVDGYSPVSQEVFRIDNILLNINEDIRIQIYNKIMLNDKFSDSVQI